jgi:hypothetical protein
MSDRLMCLHDKGEQCIYQGVKTGSGEAMNFTNPNRSQFLI